MPDVRSFNATREVVGLFGKGTLVYSLGNIIKGTPVTYNLCWKSSDPDPKLDAKYIPVGTFSLAGPRPLSETVQCVTGQSCVIVALLELTL